MRSQVWIALGVVVGIGVPKENGSWTAGRLRGYIGYRCRHLLRVLIPILIVFHTVGVFPQLYEFLHMVNEVFPRPRVHNRIYELISNLGAVRSLTFRHFVVSSSFKNVIGPENDRFQQLFGLLPLAHVTTSLISSAATPSSVHLLIRACLVILIPRSSPQALRNPSIAWQHTPRHRQPAYFHKWVRVRYLS